MAENPIHVLKFGSSVLPDERALPEAVHEIYRRVREGSRVVAVVSALGPTTDNLLAEANRYGSGPGGGPSPNALAALVATGESRAVALLALALGRAGVPARALDAAGIGLTTEGPLLDGRTVGLDVAALKRSLAEVPVLVVPGFLGRAPDGSISLLGRGGSDLTALFIAAKLGAKCTLLKDVDGLYDRDPAGRDAVNARRYEHVNYDDVLALSEGIVQHKAVRYARDSAVEFEVSCCAAAGGTVVGRRPSTFARAARHAERIKVAFFGLGTVGRGAYDELSRQSDRFQITHALVRDVEKHILAGIPEKVLVQDGETILTVGTDELPDIAVETLGGTEPAASLVRLALSRGVSVVTANKQLIAEHGDELFDIAASTGASLLYSAAVGGAVPMLETVRRLEARGVRSLEGVVNGTTNYILNRVADGLSFSESLAESQRLGFAEADPTDDVDGIDAARKLALLCREAWGVTISPSGVHVRGIRGLAAGNEGECRRLIARATFDGVRVKASVDCEALAPSHPLAELPGATNALIVTTVDGRRDVVKGLAAGRWPTSESVISDVLQLRRALLESGRPKITPETASREVPA